MTSPRKTIFLSSVQKELSTERRALRDFVRNDPLECTANEGHTAHKGLWTNYQ